MLIPTPLIYLFEIVSLIFIVTSPDVKMIIAHIQNKTPVAVMNLYLFNILHLLPLVFSL